MLLKTYFYKNLFKSFTLFLIVFSLIFVSGDLFVRLSLLPTIKSAALVFFYMLPLMFSFALPIASCMSIQTVIGNLYTTDEILFIHSLLGAKKELFRTVFIFSVALLLLYLPFTFYVVPQSYQNGKNFIVNFAKDQFYQLEEDKLHNILPNLTIYFKKRDLSQNDKPKFYNLFLTFNEKNKDRYLINSKEGFLYENILHLQKGMIQNIGKKNKFYTAQFEETKVDLKRFFAMDQKNNGKKLLKFFTIKQLLKNKSDPNVYFEFHKRLAQILWQFLFPILSLFLISLFARSKSNLLLSVILSGFLFFVFYFSINASSVLLLYPLPILLFLILLFAYRCKYNL